MKNHRTIQTAAAHPRISEETPSSSSSSSDNDNNVDLFSVESVLLDLDKASRFNQGRGGSPNGPDTGWSKRKWDVDFVRQTVDRYEYYLKQFYHHQPLQTRCPVVGQRQQQRPMIFPPVSTSSSPSSSRSIHDVSDEMKELFFSPPTTQHAFRAVLRCGVPTHVLSRTVREWEKYLGSAGMTELTDDLSLVMLEANGKAGNVGRALQLLALRSSRGYHPCSSEFVYAVTSIQVAGLQLRRNRNVFLSEQDQPSIDDPTRWLDAILLNMSQRDFPLTVSMANRMLHTYASTGKSAKMRHYFYRVVRHPVDEVEDDDQDEDEGDEEEVDVVTEDDDNNSGDDDSGSDNDMGGEQGMARLWNRPVRVRIQMRPPPPYHKIPSQVRGKFVRRPGTEINQLKLDRESDPDWSPVLTSAISFADSLKQGACGHDPIELDLISYTTLMMACVNRGSLWRAMHVLDDVMPASGIQPDAVAYNILLSGLARVGDVPTMREYYRRLLSDGLHPTKETIGAVVDGLLNLGDVGGAITFCQDSFNQHSVLPPYTTHLKILEFTLGRGLVYEAKRHVSFLQQLWKWERNRYHSDDFARLMDLTQKNPKLSKAALQKMFAYFGERLDDSDFY